MESAQQFFFLYFYMSEVNVRGQEKSYFIKIEDIFFLDYFFSLEQVDAIDPSATQRCDVM